MPKHTGIDLLVPGLLGPIPSLQEIEDRPEASPIEWCLSRADVSRIDAAGYAATLFQLFGLTSTHSSDFFTAPFCRLADGGQPDDAYWLQASPVHLRPDGDGLLLLDAGVLEITMDEAQQLVALINEHFSDRGWRLEVYDPQRWYLRLGEQPDLHTSTLAEVTGRNIVGFLPKGEDKLSWQAKMTEVQMLLHMAKVNLLREGRGQLPINGLWLHGGGRYQSVGNPGYASVFGDEALLLGMALATGIRPETLSQDSAELRLDVGKHLVVFDLLERAVLNADPYTWIKSVQGFNTWLGPLLKMVQSRRLAYLNIYPCTGQVYHITASGLRRFWRVRRRLDDHLL